MLTTIVVPDNDMSTAHALSAALYNLGARHVHVDIKGQVLHVSYNDTPTNNVASALLAALTTSLHKV